MSKCKVTWCEKSRKKGSEFCFEHTIRCNIFLAGCRAKGILKEVN